MQKSVLRRTACLAAGVVVAAMVEGAAGTYAVSRVTLPPGVPSTGRYFNTVLQQGGQLLLASSATQSTPAAPAK